MTDQRPQCGATRKDGSPCRARATDSGFCFVHDPKLASKRSAARRRGGFASSRRVRLEKQFPVELADIRVMLQDACSQVLTGSLDPRAAQAIASVATVMIRLHEVGDTEARLRALEAGATENATEDSGG